MSDIHAARIMLSLAFVVCTALGCAMFVIGRRLGVASLQAGSLLLFACAGMCVYVMLGGTV